MLSNYVITKASGRLLMFCLPLFLADFLNLSGSKVDVFCVEWSNVDGGT
jgi:hypothetical protein